MMGETRSFERRLARRYRKLSRVRYREFRIDGGGDYIEAELRDISTTGARIHGKRGFSTGTLLHVQFELIGWTRQQTGFVRTGVIPSPFAVLARVIRSDGDEMGLEFVSVDEEDRRALQRHLAHFEKRTTERQTRRRGRDDRDTRVRRRPTDPI